MKKIGDELVMRGMTAGFTTKKLDLFDGSFKTGFKLIEFQILSKSPTATTEIMGKLHTTPTTYSISEWDLGRSTEIGWASWGVPVGTRFGIQDLVDHDAVIIEDLYLTTYGTSEASEINYYIRLQKYQMPEDTAALAMIQARSQGQDAN